ncbi:uncharacterized protein TRAVEDRAFT_17053 [Trametes versicolor FP-101664 SS1]|uniref:uncharacterized protein n=1 Tax=Trametes versicolor (strain FP-101664) TaxID=717944 RepID=UPI0004623E94|nr:uncharacterized protein TRAVEDRAFT_17053 [Trametes versicolor FP-101664 SS1]EIW65287.1 hypothetical protein TRAVEDRAFT_17053 [Trametes versicolor FP-101664 SS1]
MSNVQETPVKAGASQFANHNAVQINSTDFRKGLLLELKNTVLYNRPEVEDMIFLPREHSSNKALNLLSGNDEIMQKMVKRVKHACKDSLKDVKHLAARATKKGSQPLVAPRKQELKLYAPLRNILECIESLCIRTKLDRPYYRKLICNSERPLKPDDGTTGDIFSLKPDFPLVEIRPSKDGRSEIDIDHVPEDILWRQCPAFLEVKAVDAPFPRNKPSVVKTTLAQGADYARAIFASRPFQLYVLGMYLWKTHFCFAYFDRRGVVLSKEYNLLNDDGLLKFVKAVVRFTWEMSLEDLGHDPSATLIDGTAYYDQEHPRFEVSMGQEQDTRRWRTFGKPLFASHSLLGRGTSVWQSVYLSSGNKTPAILKCAWRSATRTSETEIYDKIKSALGGRVPDGIAQPFTGGDVYLRHLHKPLSIAALRHPMEVPGTEKLVGNIRLHRVTLMDFGKTLVDYRDPKQLALVLISVLKGWQSASALGTNSLTSSVVGVGHKALHEAGILHRDISPGNILIRTLPKWMADGRLVVVDDPEDSGFLTDFEFASVPQPGTVLTTIRKTVPMPNRSRQVRKPTASDAPDQSRHLRFEYVEGKAPPKVRGPGDVITVRDCQSN